MCVQANIIKFEFCRDVEINPSQVDSSKNKAIYSQDNVTVFGLNPGSQCVALSLTALIYNHRNTTVSSRDFQNVMNTKNELYTSLPRLPEQTYSLLTELLVSFVWFDRPGESSPQKDCCW